MTTTNNTTTSTNFRTFVLFVLLVLSTGAFAQDNTTTTSAPATTATEVSVNEEKTTTVITTENTVASLDFAVWFTGVKKTSNSSSNGSFSKKQLINAGIRTNSVLVKSFLKKMNTQENGVA